MNWCLNQCENVNDQNATQADGLECCGGGGGNTKSDAKAAENEVASSEETPRSGSVATERSLSCRPYEKGGGDEPEEEISVKLKKEHEMDLEESPSFFKAAVAADNVNNVPVCNEAHNNESPGNFDFSIVCKLMDYKFDSGAIFWSAFTTLGLRCFFIMSCSVVCGDVMVNL